MVKKMEVRYTDSVSKLNVHSLDLQLWSECRALSVLSLDRYPERHTALQSVGGFGREGDGPAGQSRQTESRAGCQTLGCLHLWQRPKKKKDFVTSDTPLLPDKETYVWTQKKKAADTTHMDFICSWWNEPLFPDKLILCRPVQRLWSSFIYSPAFFNHNTFFPSVFVFPFIYIKWACWPHLLYIYTPYIYSTYTRTPTYTYRMVLLPKPT